MPLMHLFSWFFFSPVCEIFFLVIAFLLFLMLLLVVSLHFYVIVNVRLSCVILINEFLTYRGSAKCLFLLLPLFNSLLHCNLNLKTINAFQPAVQPVRCILRLVAVRFQDVSFQRLLLS
jgi:hypothetical protein